MTVLSACRSAALRLVGQRPTTLFSTADQFALELASLADETAASIAKANDWRALTRLNTITGTGSDIGFSLPADYDRMPLKANVYSSRSDMALGQPEDLDQWLEWLDDGIIGYPGYWLILGGQMQILPVLSSGETVKFYYQSNQIVSGNKTGFTADSDTFLLSERLLTLGIIWRWRAMKGLEYAEDQRNYEIAFGEEAGRDRGSKILKFGRARMGIGDVSLVGTVGNSSVDASNSIITADNG